MQRYVEIIKNHPKKTIFIGLTFISLMFIRYQHPKLIYFPNIGFGKSPSKNLYPYKNPQEQGLAYEDIEMNSRDGTKLKGWYIKCLNAKKPQRIVVYFHQNAGNIGTRITYIKQIVRKTSSNLIIVGYRGYSDSQGKPSQSGIKLDSQAILQWSVNKGIQQNLPIFILGRSLGGAATIYAVSKKQERIQGIILENTFTSIKDVALNLFPSYLKPLIRFLLFFVLSTKWRSIDIIKDIKVPILFIKSQKDELIPISQMDKLYMKCQAQKYEYRIKDGTHNQTWILDDQTYFQKLNNFFKGQLKERL